MTQKDYIKIAEILREVRKHLNLGDSFSMVGQFANMLEADNPRFNREKFFEAVFQF